MPNKQEEIKEGIAKLILGKRSILMSCVPVAEAIMAYLHSQGCVLKVDWECLHCAGTGFSNFQINGNSTVCPMCKGGKKHVAVEPLIEEVQNAS